MYEFLHAIAILNKKNYVGQSQLWRKRPYHKIMTIMSILIVCDLIVSRVSFETKTRIYCDDDKTSHLHFNFLNMLAAHNQLTSAREVCILVVT